MPLASSRWIGALAVGLWLVCVPAACGPSPPGAPDPDGMLPDPTDSGPGPDAPATGCQGDVDCNDGIACTIDHCDLGTGECTTAPCSDCCGDGLECDPDLGCTTARTPCTIDDECADSIPCTLDRCLDGTFCEHAPQDGLCETGEICLPALGCIPTPPAVCASDQDCFPGQPCLGEWSCLDEFGCQFIRPPDCDDGDPCSADSCDDVAGCVHDVPTEVCNGMDDDCDTMIDEGFECVAGSVDVPCAASCGTGGTADCGPGCVLGACTPPAETCTGIDDDCDGLTDEGFACVAGTSGMCATTCGSTGTRDCLGDCTFDTCVPPAETCNGVDDDCDAAPDDGFACVRGASLGGCLTTCGSTGSRSCSDTCTPGACVPPFESCNGLDDDCDSALDETFPCVAGASLGSCTTTCGSAGTQSCTASCMPGACTPPAEACNGVDDDCDAACDEGFTCCAGTTTSCSIVGGGTGMAVCTSGCTWDTSGCAVSFDPSGTYLVSPAPTKTCAFGLVSFSIGSFTFSDSGSVLVVTGAPCTMTGGTASGGTIDVTCLLPGSCDERYTLTGSFTGPDTWSGSFAADFTPHGGGACFDCSDQTWAVTGMR